MYDPLDYKLSEFNKHEPEKGRILISDPFLPDPYFNRSVVLLVDHHDDGSLGFIINKPLEISLDETELKIDGAHHKMYFGGPVQSSDLFYIHNRGKDVTGSTEIKDGLWWGGDFDVVESMLKEGTLSEKDIRFFVGYSGWEADQLNDEIEENSWLVVDIDLAPLFETESENLWKTMLEEMDGQISVLSTFPEDPNLN